MSDALEVARYFASGTIGLALALVGGLMFLFGPYPIIGFPGIFYLAAGICLIANARKILREWYSL